MRLWVGVATLAFIVVVILISVIVPIKIGQNYLTVKAYFPNPQDLQPGAPVQVGGVTVGVVSRVRPDPRGGPTEVTMVIRAAKLGIRSDASVSLARKGMVGQLFVVIDMRQASGAPVSNGAVLQTRAAQSLTVY